MICIVWEQNARRLGPSLEPQPAEEWTTHLGCQVITVACGLRLVIVCPRQALHGGLLPGNGIVPCVRLPDHRAMLSLPPADV